MKRFFALLACLAVGQVAQGALTATFVKNAETDSIFAPHNTYALQVTSDTDWQTGNVNIQLTSGSLLNIPTGFPAAPRPGFAGLGDSGIFGKDFAEPTIAPGAVSSATVFNASWGTTAATDTGSFYIGAFTFSPDANGTLTGRVVAQNPDDDINGFIYNLEGWSIVNGAIIQGTDPDPVPALGLVASNAGGLSAALQGVWNSKVSGSSISLIDGLMITNDDPNSDDITELGAIGSSVEITNYAGQGVIGTVSAGTVPGKYSLLLTGPFQDFDPSVPLTGNVNFTSANGGNASLAFSVAVPEPSTVALSALALVGLVGFARRKK